MNACRDCRHWDVTLHGEDEDFGDCTRIMEIDNAMSDDPAMIFLDTYPYGETDDFVAYVGKLETHGGFHCALFETKVTV